MKAQWEAWLAKFDALQQRERMLVVLAVLVVIWALFDNLLLTPMLQKQKAFSVNIATRQGEVRELQQQTQQILEAAKVDPDAGSKQLLGDLKVQLAEKDARLQAMQSELITPDRMPRVLESLLQRDKSVRLVSLTTMPVSGLMDAAVTAGDSKPVSEISIYKHGFEVILEGGYLDLMRYVAALERSPWHMLWGGMVLDASNFQKTKLTLTIYTLSLDKTWLSI